MLKIHNFARGGRGLRVAWLCEEMGLDYEVVNHPFPVPDSYLALNPLGTVPYLGGRRRCRSQREHRDPALRRAALRTDPALSDRFFADGTLPAADAVRRDRARHDAQSADRCAVHGGAGRPAQLVRPGTRAPRRRSVDYIERELRGRPFLVGHDLTLADISVGCGLGIWTGALGGELPEGLAGYQGRLRSRPAYERARSRCEEKARTAVDPRE